MKVVAIVAMDLDRGIGKNNDLMWHLPADMQFFKKTTTGHIVIMGRKNFESIPERFRPLPNRENAVLTRNNNFTAEGCIIFNSLEACLAHYQQETERIVFIIGGGEIYRESIEKDMVDEIYLTKVNHRYGADTFLVDWDENRWSSSTVLQQSIDEKHPVDFEIIHYTKK